MKDKLKVTIAQYGNNPVNSQSPKHKKDAITYANPNQFLSNFFNAIEVAKSNNADFLVFPELFMPTEYVYSYLLPNSEEHKLIIISGIEWQHTQTSNGKKYVNNQAVVTIPSTFSSNKRNQDGQATLINISKLYAAETEAKYLNEKGYGFKNGNKIFLFESEALGNWAILICVDYLNLPIQVLLQGKIQTLFIIAENKDVNYYLSLSDSLHRILFCNVIVCNSGNYGGSHAFTPLREHFKREVFKAKGNNIDFAVTLELHLKLIKDGQKGRILDESTPELISKPPNFGEVLNIQDGR